jgi:hypothetical protein
MKATFLWRWGGRLNGGGRNHFARTTPIGGFAMPPFFESARPRCSTLKPLQLNFLDHQGRFNPKTEDRIFR